MIRNYTGELKKIEASLVTLLPPSLSLAWKTRVFPGLELKNEAAENLIAPGRDIFMRGGKRWRPLLAHLVCRALGGGDAALPLLPLVEFTHNASLIHDDLEDNSDERRDKPAIHLLYGNDTAINSGSFLYLLPLAALENYECDPEDKNRLWKHWAELMRFLHLGQSMDIAWHRDISIIPSLDDYMVMCRLKTGCLAKFAVILGIEAARIAQKNDAADNGRDYNGLMTGLGEAAQQLGVGFQILDDVKNLSTGIPGKKRGDDVVEGKKSLPVLLFLQNEDKKNTMNRSERGAFVLRCFEAARAGGVNVPEVKEFIEKLTESGSLQEAEKQGKDFIAGAISAFSGLKTIDGMAGNELSGLLEDLNA